MHGSAILRHFVDNILWLELALQVKVSMQGRFIRG